MFAYIVRRTIVGIVLLLAMSFVVFVLFFATGDPARNTCGKYCTPQKLEDIRRVLGYDKSPAQQYALFVKGVFVGRDYPVNDAYRAALEKRDPSLVTHCAAPCLGYSSRDQETVNQELKTAAPVTISLSVVAFLMWMIIGIPLGVLAAVKKGQWTDRILVGATLVLYSMPVFFIGNFLLKYVATKWQWVPQPSYVSIADGGPFNWFLNLLLPGVTLAVFYMAAYVRITRAFMLETLTEDYIRTAQAKGLKRGAILFKHALRATLTPLVTMAGLDFASLLAGAIITESVFTFPGLGFLAREANQNDDLPILIGLLLVAGAAVVVANIVVDILYAFIDPRVRLD
ncbi:MAG TPA: ABC transporter permease [Nocardioides sp.]|nr:ABC transporter permease [Nocardioides sp.]